MIPATTIKGVLRDNVTRILGVCKNLKFFNEPVVKIFEDDDRLKLYKQSTIIDRIFGSTVNEGTLYFESAKMSQGSLELVSEGEPDSLKPASYLQTQQRTQTRIMRQTKTVASGALFNSEFGNPQIKFEGKISGQLEGIQIELSPIPGVNYEFLILLCALKMMDRIGGNKSTGMGEISLIFEKIILNGTQYSMHQFMNNAIWENLQFLFETERGEINYEN
jgi:CRISPR/Cas system CSM-associated protein Csm3 (group 7 of RAMP superfamily)